MNPFDFLIVQPIFNALVAIYGLLPGGDFGVAVIIFTILVRLLMWPLIKKQLHQTKVMRDLQPELKKLKARSNGNKQLEAQMMMELYREKGVNPFSSIGLLLVQLPIFIALYQVINIITSQRDRIAAFTYQPLENLPAIKSIIDNPNGFNENLFGVVNLAQAAISQGGLYLPAVLLAVLAAALQYWQSKQLTPKPEEGKRLRDILKQQAAGKQVDQSEVSAAVSNRMLVILPFVTLLISLYLPGALVLYFAVSSLVAVIQQHVILNKDVDEMEELADKKSDKKPRKKVRDNGSKDGVKVRRYTVAERAEKAQTAEIVAEPGEEEKPAKKAKKNASKKKRGGKRG